MRQRGKRAEAVSGDDSLPLEPEVEQIAVDEQGSGAAFEVAQKPDQRALGIEGRDAKMRIGDYVARRREHTPIVAAGRCLYKPAA